MARWWSRKEGRETEEGKETEKRDVEDTRRGEVALKAAEGERPAEGEKPAEEWEEEEEPGVLSELLVGRVVDGERVRSVPHFLEMMDEKLPQVDPRQYAKVLGVAGAGLLGVGALAGVPLGMALGKVDEREGGREMRSDLWKRKKRKKKVKAATSTTIPTTTAAAVASAPTEVRPAEAAVAHQMDGVRLATRALLIATLLNVVVGAASVGLFVHCTGVKSPEEAGDVFRRWTGGFRDRLLHTVGSGVEAVANFGRMVGHTLGGGLSSFAHTPAGRRVSDQIDSASKRRYVRQREKEEREADLEAQLAAQEDRHEPPEQAP